MRDNSPFSRGLRKLFGRFALPGASRPTDIASLPVEGGNQFANPGSNLSQAAKRTGADAWSRLRVTLQSLENNLDVFPPLRSAVAGFLEVVDIFETAAQNREDYAGLASNLRRVVREFKNNPGEHTSSKMSDAMKAMASALKAEMEHVQEQRQHSGLERHLEEGNNADDVQECYHRVETLCRELQNAELLKTWSNAEELQLDAPLNKLNAALTATYDSEMSTAIGRRGCTPGTRKLILEGMRMWVDDPRGPKVYWLTGTAGTGKTTLAYSFCTEMKAARRLGASFFCSRAHADSRDVSRVVPTIAYQLASLLPVYREALIQQIGGDEDIGKWTTKRQFQKLILDPLREIKASVLAGIVFTIDALDECNAPDAVQDILNVLLFYARDLRIKFFVTCRPQPELHDALNSKDERSCPMLHLHDLGKTFAPTIQADIRTYLKDELASISLSQEKLEQLAERAGTRFFYAATAVHYIDPKGKQSNSRQRLEDLLSIPPKTETTVHQDLDDLHIAVLTAMFASEDLTLAEKKTIRLVLDMAVCAKESTSVKMGAKLLGLDEQDINYALSHLRCVLHIPHGADHILAFHQSFPDFMLSHERSGDLCCNAAEHNRQLALGCFITMQRFLRFNICELESSFVLDTHVPNLAKKIDDAISPELFYACSYWGDHLDLAGSTEDVCSALEEFLSNRLLFWMEVMNLRNCLGAGAKMLSKAHRWLKKLGRTNDTAELALDAHRFVTAFGTSEACRSTPHIYISALAFWPETRPISQQYRRHTRGLIRLNEQAIQRKDRTTTGSVRCTAVSPDGTRVVSGSSDKTIRVWDARSGDAVAGPFRGHISSVTSVGFSPDGTHIVSGSDDSTIRVWDARSGDVVTGPLKGHAGPVLSVGFSPEGTRIVSGSSDKTIRVWDAHSGDAVTRPFEGHTGAVLSVGFSPDGTRIVSGSKDHTIRVWDAHSGDVVAASFRGRTSSVTSVAFSPDGTHIVSGSYDSTISVWDARNGNIVAGPFKGHTGEVLSVGFSPDGTRIVSGSWDKTIRVWDARSGDLVAGPIKGHTGWVTSVGFSPDGTRIVSGSDDKTIRFWDALIPDLAESQRVGDWLMDEGGMVTTKQGQLLLHIPVDYRPGILRPPNTVCIGKKGTRALDFTGVLLGHDWVESYQS